MPDDWPFRDRLTHERVYEGFKILSLLEHHTHQKTSLAVLHTAEARNQYDDAMQERNLFIRKYGQPEIGHLCRKCVRQDRDDENSCCMSDSPL
jgi:hypothetical protein